MLNLAVILEDSARKFPDKRAFIFGDQSKSFSEINQAANQIANGLLNLGIQPGDKVALSCPNLPYFPIIYFGILKAGAVVVPFSILLKGDEIQFQLTNSDARVFFCFEGTPNLPMGLAGLEGYQKCEGCEEMILIPSGLEKSDALSQCTLLSEFMAGQSPTIDSVPTSAEDTAVIIYTSGTTGRPKGAELTHSNMAWNADLCRHLFQFQAEDRLLIVLPLFHIFGQTCLMNAGIMHGLTSTLLPRFEVATVEDSLINDRITIFAGVPTMYWALLNQGNDARVEMVRQNLRQCVSGGASLPLQVLEGFEKKYKVPIFEGYGMSEGSPVVTFNQPGQERKPGSIGTPVWGIDVKVVDENDEEVAVGEKGELLYRGHNVMKGYYQNPEANAVTLRGGWLHSGDVAVKDEDGYYFIVDRTKDMIIRGGLNVYPREVEELMMKHDAISLVAVIGIPDEKFGEEIKAFVVLKDDVYAEAEDLIEWVKERIASYKYPRTVTIVDELPMSATGKILKRELRKI